MGSLDFAVQLRCAALYVGMHDPKIFCSPMEFGLEFVTVVGSHLTNADCKVFDDMINELDRVCPSMLFVDLEGTNSRCMR